MKLRTAAAFTGIVILLCLLTALFVVGPGLHVLGLFLPRQEWLTDNMGLWVAGLWLWLLGIFSWMVMLVALIWSYSPVHRIATMLQSGLMIIAAVLAIGGVVVWMNVLPVALEPADAHLHASLVDALALGLLGAGLFMGGAVTLWVGLDLARLSVLPKVWLLPLIVAGICALPAPFLLPHAPWLLAVGAVIWCAGGLFFAAQRQLPGAYAEWS